MNGLNDWESLRGNFGACASINQKVIHVTQNSGTIVYLVRVDVKRLNVRYRYPDSPHEITLRCMLERVSEYCSGTSEMGNVNVDIVPQQNDFDEGVKAFTRVNTPVYRSQKFLCVGGDIEFVDSRSSRGVQAADMSAYILRRYREETGGSKAGRKVTKRLVKALGSAVVHQRKWLP
ncbi:DUF3800 domain-containing protein [Corynebacterium cystitidis]|nr:DUF3800 domain-containing protein [Corynebacterium cystitidis]